MVDAAPVQEDQEAEVVEAVTLPSLTTRIGWFEAWQDQTRTSRKASRRARDFYDNHQWARDEIEELKHRLQPITTNNLIARKINYILGEEIRKRVDPVARPRTPQHEDAARAATDALRYAEEEEKFDKARSAVLKNVIIEGFGGGIKEMEEIYGSGPAGPDGRPGRPVVVDYKHVFRHVEWDRLGYDPISREVDFSDALYLFVITWVDLADAVATYPDARHSLEEAVRTAGGGSDTDDDVPRGKAWVDGRRKRVKIIEMYFRAGKNWYRSDFTDSVDLRPPERTFILDEQGQHSVCPLVMVSCYVDADGNRYGIVELLMSCQELVNKFQSKLMHWTSVDRTTAEDGVVTDPIKYQSERAKPDGFMTVRANALAEGRVRNETGSEMAQGQLLLLQQAKESINTIGPSASNMADLAGGTSGRAFIARQQSASQEIGNIFDQIKDWTHSVFCLDWLCIRQYWTTGKWLRVTDDRELTGYRFVRLNQPVTRAERFQELIQSQPPVPPPQALQTAAGDVAPEILAGVQAVAAQQMQAMAAMQAQGMGPPAPPQPPDIVALIMKHPLMQRVIDTRNQPEKMLVDIVIDEAPETAVLVDEQFEIFSNIAPAIVQARPDMAAFVMRTLVQLSAFRNKREVLQEFDKGPDPAQMQAQQQAQVQAQQIAQAMAQVQMAVGQTKAQLQQAQAAEAGARAAKTGAEAQAVPAKTQSQIQTAGIDTAIKLERERRAAMPKALIIAEGVPAPGPAPAPGPIPFPGVRR